MLKALELVGFKSFADRTRFEFPPGISVVVGPNGSGKSNVVDAIKWVLGEQSARSLRGKEMADVIFKGSGNGQRKPANMAEATIIFDNADRLLDVDAAEVQVTRRVYRGGEGEYLINGQPTRLKDIKQLFRGTGVGTDAYSLIEQGKVDSLLQASSQDRRAILEEAAGISRFKAKKVEAERRLDRIQQNLLRLCDIVDEVEGRLKKLRSQATKARRYKEISDRLQSLRTQVGHSDWLELTTRLQANQATLDRCREQVAALQRQAADAVSQADAQESVLQSLDQQLLAVDHEWKTRHDRQAETTSQQAVLSARMAEIAKECDRYRRRIVQLTEQLQVGEQERCDAEHRVAESSDETKAHEEQLRASQQEADHCRHEVDVRKPEELRAQTELDRYHDEHSANDRELARCLASLESALQRRDEAAQRRADLAPSMTTAAEQLEQLRGDHAQAIAEAESHRTRRSVQESTFRALQQQLDQFRARRTALHERRIAVGERVAVLQEFLQQRVGVGDGVQAVLARSGPTATPPFDSIRGIVADVIEVHNRELAAVIGIALADRAQHIVVAGHGMTDYLERESLSVPGRVGFLRIPTAPPPPWPTPVELDEQPGVIGRADRLVDAVPGCEYLVQWLLGDTWIVESLARALQYSRQITAPVRFVTLQGELLERDGRLLIGPATDADELLSRHTELREQRRALEACQVDFDQAEQELQQLEQQAQSENAAVTELQESSRGADSRVSRLKLALDAAQQSWQGLEQRMQELMQDESHATAAWQECHQRREQLIRRNSECVLQMERLRSVIQTHAREIRDHEVRLGIAEQSVASHQVLVETSRARLEDWQRQLQQNIRAQNDRQLELQQVQLDLEAADRRIQESECQILELESELSHLAIELDQLAESMQALTAKREQASQTSRAERESAQRIQAELHDIDQRRHAAEMEVERARLERQSLAERLRDDYGVDIESVHATLSPEELAQREEIDREIVELRRKLTQLGAINMDALTELTDLEQRYEQLSSQYKDLVDAKATLEKIIQKINADSRKLYAETLEAVRGNFQILFRKVFGGGRADIVLEEDKDLLESGIDIVATPPGKHSLSLSLLSGGERALTAVTLLLALFQYRPSPFCVLDEVDGPLDEANIGRFIGVLKEFLQWTRFIVVTHSKKTMTAANTLYGVTMQESGVSKRVSVRFEDVNEQGEILRTRDDTESDSERGAA